MPQITNALPRQGRLFTWAALVMLTFLTRLALTRSTTSISGVCNSSHPHLCARNRRKLSETSMAPGGVAKRDAIKAAPSARASSGNGEGEEVARNVLGGRLELCCNSPRTGFFRDGFCHTGPHDTGVHTVCARVTTQFLEFSRARGNDLMSPAPQYGFPGLSEGDGWCLCASRWLEAAREGAGCPVVLAATHEKTLETVPLDVLMEHAIDRPT